MDYHFEKLEVWQQSFKLAKEIYKVTSGFPSEQNYTLTSQLQRAAISVPLNIAEGSGRAHKKELIQFCHIARGSLYETVTLVKLACELGYFSKGTQKEILDSCESIFYLLNGLIKSLRVKDKSATV